MKMSSILRDCMNRIKFNGMDSLIPRHLAYIFHSMEICNDHGKSKFILLPIVVHLSSILWVFIFPVS